MDVTTEDMLTLGGLDLTNYFPMYAFVSTQTPLCIC